jgi:amino acid transporter
LALVGSAPAVPMAAPRRVNAFQLAMMTFFLTTGGPFGSEPAIGAAGMLYTLIGFSVVPLVWSLPQTLMAAELSLMFPCNGGPIFWVYYAFGPLVGWINAYSNVIYSFLCNCLVVAIFADYFPGLTDPWAVVGVRCALMVLVTLLNLFAVDWISNVSGILFLIIELPFVLMFVLLLARRDTGLAHLLDRPDAADVNWPLFVSITTWCFGGYDSLGCLAGEARSPRHFVAGLALSLPLTVFNYLVPLAVGYLSDPVRADWSAGNFTAAAADVAAWLGIWMIVASAVSNFGGVNAGTTALVRLIWAMAGGVDEERAAIKVANSDVSADEETSSSSGDVDYGLEEPMLPHLMACSVRRYPIDSPVLAVVATSVLTVLVAMLDFAYLIELTLTMRILQLLLEYGALSVLRWRQPQHPRPFRVPFGLFGTVGIALPSVALSVLLVVLQSWKVTVVGFGINLLFLLMYAVHRLRVCGVRVARAAWVERCRRAAGAAPDDPGIN